MVVTHDATRCVCYANGMSWKPFEDVLMPSLDRQVVLREMLFWYAIIGVIMMSIICIQQLKQPLSTVRVSIEKCSKY